MNTLQRFLLLAMVALTLPSSSLAQVSLTSGLGFTLDGFATVAGDGANLMAGRVVEETVVYETNRVDQTVYVRVEGDMTGLELRIDPVVEQQTVLGVATSGQTGQATALTMREEGELPLVVGVTGAGVRLPIKYTVVALDPAAKELAEHIRITFAIN